MYNFLNFQGRNQLGSVYVWAAGNGNTDDNCNCDGYVNNIYTIAVNSVSPEHSIPGYAEPCTAVMTSAFSGAGRSGLNIVRFFDFFLLLRMFHIP